MRICLKVSRGTINLAYWTHNQVPCYWKRALHALTGPESITTLTFPPAVSQEGVFHKVLVLKLTSTPVLMND